MRGCRRSKRSLPFPTCPLCRRTVAEQTVKIPHLLAVTLTREAEACDFQAWDEKEGHRLDVERHAAAKMYAKMRSGIWIVRSMCSGDRKGKEEQGPRGEQAGIGSEAGGTGEAMYVTGDKLRCNDQMRQIFVETGGGKTIILDLLPVRG